MQKTIPFTPPDAPFFQCHDSFFHRLCIRRQWPYWPTTTFSSLSICSQPSCPLFYLLPLQTHQPTPDHLIVVCRPPGAPPTPWTAIFHPRRWPTFLQSVIQFSRNMWSSSAILTRFLPMDGLCWIAWQVALPSPADCTPAKLPPLWFCLFANPPQGAVAPLPSTSCCNQIERWASVEHLPCRLTLPLLITMRRGKNKIQHDD